MGLYLQSGYLNMDHVMENRAVFSFIVGGRGIGKTFGSLKYVIENDIKFIYMRRTQTQVDMIKSDDLNPFVSLRTVLGADWQFCMKKINKNITGVYRGAFDPDSQTYSPAGPVLGYIMALSTVSNIRGFDASDVRVLIYDEFIPERHERQMTAEAAAFLNAVETIGRNRELSFQDPLKVICLSNANDLANPIFIELKLVGIVEKMLAQGVEYKLFPERRLAVYILHDSQISQKKADTSLYQLVGRDSEFAQMSISNDFTQEERALIRSENIKEYKPLVRVGEISIYKHKSQRRYYITDFHSGNPERYESGEMDLKRFTRDYYYLWLSYLNRNIIFESYVQQIIFEKYFNMRK